MDIEMNDTQGPAPESNPPTADTKPRSRSVAMFLTGMVGGLGHIYLGQRVKGVLMTLINLAACGLSLLMMAIPAFTWLMSDHFNTRMFQTGLFLQLAFLISTMYAMYDTYRLTGVPVMVAPSSTRLGVLGIVNLVLCVVVIFNLIIIILLLQ